MTHTITRRANKLNPEEQETVKKLASILRIADGLDRTHSLAVKDIVCRNSKKGLTIFLKPLNSSPTDLEIWGADRKKGLFEEIFDVKVEFMIR